MPAAPALSIPDLKDGAFRAFRVKCDMASHMLFDRFGGVLPVAVYCDYIGARMHNGAYDLKRAVEILANDARIRFVRSARNSKNNSNPIEAIPYYNAEDGRSECISFWFSPTAEDARLLWKKQQAYGGRYPSTRLHEAMFDLDILGLREGGAARFASYFGD